ncbi:MAG: hypothetical protein IKP37_09765 [Paludibacteraceae bacterium]|nr:hypothetical protein [Paludibacteraceae bacterium]
MRNLFLMLSFGTLFVLMAFTDVADKKKQLFSILDYQISGFAKARSSIAEDYYSADDMREYDRDLSELKSERSLVEKDLDEWLSVREKTGDADSLTTVLLGHLVKLCKLSEY